LILSVQKKVPSLSLM